MFRTITCIVVFVVAATGTTFAQRGGPLANALSTASVRSALSSAHPAAPTSGQATAQAAQKKSHPIRKGFLIGSAVGLIVGIGSMNSAVDNCPQGRSCSTAGVGAASYMLLGAGIGSFVGWLYAK